MARFAMRVPQNFTGSYRLCIAGNRILFAFGRIRYWPRFAALELYGKPRNKESGNNNGNDKK
jgi:hypothetical protein